MSGRRRGAAPVGDAGGGGVARNKRGTPMYSREDIREQYCINDKELHALEQQRRKPIFGCLTSSNSTEVSPGKKKSLLPACLRGRVPSDENVYVPSTPLHHATAPPSASSSPHRRHDPHHDPIDYEDESYFKRRPKTICYTDPRRLAALDDSLARSGRSTAPTSRPRSEAGPQYDTYNQDDANDAAARRPTQLAVTSGEYHSTDVYRSDGGREGYTRSAFTQPNTPELGHASRYRQVTPASPSHLDHDLGRHSKHVSFHKAMSRSATVGGLEDQGMARQDSGRASVKSGGSRSHERLLDGRRTPDYMEQRALDQLLAPVLTKALLQEKLKRSSMRTQATQTEVGQVRKSLPSLALSPTTEKAEMVSQGAQTNGVAGRRKLVKSFSEAATHYDPMAQAAAAHFEGIEYEIYDLDALVESPPPFHGMRAASEEPCVPPPPAPPPFTSASLDFGLDEALAPPPPLRFRQNYHDAFDVSPRKPRRPLLQKTLSEGEILCERRRALSLASGYIEVDINGFADKEAEEEVIEPQCVDECSRDLSLSRIFSHPSLLEEEEEFHEDMMHKDILPPSFPSPPERKMSQISSDSDLKTFDPHEFSGDDHLQSQLAALSSPSLPEGTLLGLGTLPDMLVDTLLDTLTDTLPDSLMDLPDTLADTPPDTLMDTMLREGSPLLYPGCPQDLVSPGEGGDHLEESVSESQVTVVPRLTTSQVITSDSENGSFHLTDPSSAATTPSTRHKSLPHVASLEEDLEDEMMAPLHHTAKVLSATTLSSIEDEPTSISENVISDSSQGIASTSTTSSEVDKAIASSAESDFMSIRSSELEGSVGFGAEVEAGRYEGEIVIEENMMAVLVGGLEGGLKGDIVVPRQFLLGQADLRDDHRKLVSPESSSSSSHFTEQETSRSPGTTTNTVTSRSDLSRTDSHHTDQSETSEDYVTATDTSVNGRGYSYYDERHVSSPPDMDDIFEDEALTPKILSPIISEVLGDILEAQELSDVTEGLSVTSDFETAQDLTSPDGDTTTSASYYIDHSIGSESDKTLPDIRTKPQVPPKPTFIPKPEVPPKPGKLSPIAPRMEEAKEETGEEEEEEDEDDATTPQFPEIQLEITVKRREKAVEERVTGAIKKRYSGRVAKDDHRRYSKYFEEDDEGEVAEVKGGASWTEEDREKAKQTLKLDIPPGVTMFGDAPAWPHADLRTGDVERKLKIFEKPKKSVKIDLASMEDLTAVRIKAESPQGKADKTKRKSEEVTTPGMVRSPAMHEGFRLEDWTPIRTPGTPEESFEVDTSDESFSERSRHPPRLRSPGKRSTKTKGKEGSPERDVEGPPMISERTSPGVILDMVSNAEDLRTSPPKLSQQSPRAADTKHGSPSHDTVKTNTAKPDSVKAEAMKGSVEVKLRPKTPTDPRKRLSDVSVGSGPEVTDPQKRHSAEVRVEVQEHLRIKGPVTGYLRAGSQSPTSRERPLQLPDSQLLSIAPLKDVRSAESLRSLSPGSDNVFLGGSREGLVGSREGLVGSREGLVGSREGLGGSREGLGGSREGLVGSREGLEEGRLCVQCGERPTGVRGTSLPPPGHTVTVERRLSDREPSRARPVSHRAKSEERNSFTRDWGMTPISLEVGDAPRHESDDDELGVYVEAYRAAPWVYVASYDEAKVWRRDEGRPTAQPPEVRIIGPDDDVTAQDITTEERARRGSSGSTASEAEFRRKYQAITHRMVHRKASVEMYKRLIQATFQSDKTVTVSRESGEFGFRIHGSRPVVVSAIEPDTPAETCGLEVGDIIITINGANVLDASHSDVVRLAHPGCDTLQLEVARTCDVLTPLVTPDPAPLCAGYLYKLGGARHSPGAPGITRTWRRRWFALKKDHCLYYYKSETEQHPLGALHLADYSVHALADVDRPYCFTVAKFGGMTLHLAAHTDDARNRWGQVITQAAVQAGQRDDLLEVSSRRVQQAPSAIISPDCFGFLHKLGTRWHQWKRRYCVLKDACLYLYHDTEATQAIGVVYLHGYRVQSTSIGGKRHAFELLPPEPKFRHFYFYTESDSDKKRWLAALEYSIDRWIRVG